MLIVGALVGAVLIPTAAATAAPSPRATAPKAAASAATNSTTTLIGFGSADWSYFRGTSAPAATWTSSKVAGWAAGKAPLGFGTNAGPLGTTLKNSFATKPLASYFQKSFTLPEVPAAGVALTTWADDGVIVYVNGKEVVRKNLPTGTIKDTSYATAAPQSTAAQAAKVTATIPASALKAGSNLISVQVQSNWRNTPNSTFDAQLTMVRSTAAVPTPTPTTPAAPTPTPKPTSTPTATPAPTPTKVPVAPAPEQPESSTGNIPGWGAPSWRDEFDYVDPTSKKPAIDPTKWNVRDRSDLGLLFDAAVPSKDQVSVDANGVAHLKATWLDTPVIRPANQTGPTELWHKTAYMDQRSLRPGDVSKGQQYGRWEMKAKVPTGPKTYGALAAFWLRNSQSGEIDMMEAWGYNDKAAPGGQRINTATTTVHTQTSGAGNEKYIWHHSDFGAPTPIWDGFHTFAFELTPSYASIIIDGKKIMTTTPAASPNLWNAKYFGSPLHMRLNLHVGPSEKYWGLPDPAHKDWTQNLDFQVDYVRTWAYQG
ncbi:glycoside hydrolase family 16 protein [Glaciibacter psychrotolerans]|uniref:GH16 domain-containing protein n=1 Tax=Glaciibacter psychrotolerans TaxID=670054 RepID=A0A7Z0EHM5_9MICO|nr:family 16 glycosylhydrolase [Leifsonia psychrotolerans]NYJ21400.1 hypothetical protein [Leifsonia psychrotolerans]